MNQLSLIPDNREKTYVTGDAVHLPDMLNLSEQQIIVSLCRDAAKQNGMHPQACNREGTVKTQVKILSFGCWWALLDGYMPEVLPIPEILVQVANRAIDAALPRYAPYILPGEEHKYSAICQWYDPGKTLGMHTDDSEDRELLEAGHPVVSLSFGDSCMFRFGAATPRKIRDDIELRSGDAFVFGGRDRLSYHGVPRLLADTAPPLIMKPGRLNITIRRAKV